MSSDKMQYTLRSMIDFLTEGLNGELSGSDLIMNLCKDQFRDYLEDYDADISFLW